MACLIPLSQLVNTAVSNTVRPFAHVGWARLPTWLKPTLGDAWDVQYGQVTVNKAESQALWFIHNTDSHDCRIRVHISVVSVIAQDGHLDMDNSAAAVREYVGHILMSTTRGDVWTSRTLPGLEQASLQYADHIEAGRIVLVTGNVVMDIAGMTSSETLLPYALKLFNQTVRRDPSPPVFPVLQRQAVRMENDNNDLTYLREPEVETDIITVTGIDTRFSVVILVSCKIAAASAACDETGVLFDRYTVKELDDRQGCTVELFFVVREAGHHHVHVYMADLETMVQATSALEIEVVGA